MQFRQAAYRFGQGTVPADLNDYDWIWLRLPPPIPDGFFDFLRAVYPEERIINRPSGIEATSTKAFITQLPKWAPDTRLCRNFSEVEAMQAEYPIVLKPLHSYGGHGIVKVAGGQVTDAGRAYPLHRYRRELETGFARGGYLGMRFLKNVSQGDKRTVVINGRILGSVLRMPLPGAWLCNAAQGGQAVIARPDQRERQMARELSDMLTPMGILMFGMDTLVNDEQQRVLSEVNTLSIGGIQPMETRSGKPIADRAAQQIARYLAAHSTAPLPIVF